jgi:FkbM family methyltransferase
MGRKTLAIKALKLIYTEYRSLCWDINGKFRKSVTISTKQGIFTVLFSDNEISKALYCYGQYELDLVTDTLKYLRSINKCPPRGEGTILDIGANNGVISIGALHTGELEKAISIEPDPQNFSLLQRNVNQNGLKDRVICLPYAVSHQQGEVFFELSDSNFGDHRVRATSDLNNPTVELFDESQRRVISVRSDQLDSLLSNLPDTFTRNISIIWIDVQGHEGYVFMGARDLLLRDIPVVCEVWPYGIKRSGMDQEQFCGIAQSIWSYYWVKRGGKYVRYPINMFQYFYDGLGYDTDRENIIFTY